MAWEYFTVDSVVESQFEHLDVLINTEGSGEGERLSRIHWDQLTAWAHRAGSRAAVQCDVSTAEA
jgi:hypothetical protein